MASKTLIKKDFSTGGVVWDAAARAFLLIRVENLSGNKVWTFPKGHPEKDESEEQAALREVLEETGWTCEVIKPITDVHYYYVHNGVRFSKTVRWFLMKPIKDSGSFDTEEVLECRWVNQDEAMSLVTYGSDKDLLKETALLL